MASEASNASEAGKTSDESLSDVVANLIIGEPKYTPDEVASAVGMDLDDADRLWIELGFSPIDRDERHFTDADIEVLRMLRDLRETYSVEPDLIISMTRVLGQALSRVAYAQAESVEVGAGSNDTQDADNLMQLNEEALPRMANLLFDGKFEKFLLYAWRRHLAEAVRRRLESHESDYIVGFADLVGYSSLTSRMEPEMLPDLIGRFEQFAYQHVAQAGGRVLKLIGDAVMFTAPSAEAAAAAALGLRSPSLDGLALPKVRVGMATGPAVAIEGDLFGETVNRANRLTDLAHPGTVLVDDELGRALEDDEDVAVRVLRPRKVKGLGYLRPWVLRPVDTGES
jgi:adenylate cyclase